MEESLLLLFFYCLLEAVYIFTQLLKIYMYYIFGYFMRVLFPSIIIIIISMYL